jgi:hypothetical protein
MAYGIISADCHLDPEFLPQDTFTSRVTERLRDSAPRVRDGDGGTTWFAGDVRLGPWGTRRIREILAMGHRGTVMVAAGFDPEQFRPTDARLRIEDQEKDIEHRSSAHCRRDRFLVGPWKRGVR